MYTKIHYIRFVDNLILILFLRMEFIHQLLRYIAQETLNIEVTSDANWRISKYTVAQEYQRKVTTLIIITIFCFVYKFLNYINQ